MAVDNDPSMENQSKDATLTSTKDVVSETQCEKFTSQDQERKWFDSLLDNSPQDDNLESFLNCVSWGEAAIGWRLAIPNVTYISRVPESNSRKDGEKEKDGKSKNSLRLSPFDRDQSWKKCVEPGTYRYIHKAAHGKPLKKSKFNKGPVKRPMDAHLQEHIRKVKEHLEKVLVQQATPRGHHRPLGEVQNHGDYVTSLIRETKTNRSQPVARYSPRPNKLEDQAQTLTNIPDVGLSYTLKRSSPSHKSPQPHHPKTKTPDDLVTALGNKLNQLIQQDSFKTKIKTNKSTNNTDETLRSSYEKFPAYTIPDPAHVDSPTLKPLVRVTPGQRKIHDDNEIIGAVAQMNLQLRGIPTPPSPSNENHDFQYEKSRTQHDNSPIISLEETDPLNKNFFSCGLMGKAVSPSDIRIQTHLSSILNNTKNTVKVKKRGTLRPQKQGQSTHTGKGEHGLSVTNRLGDPLHRGVMDRETAGAIASELLPGVSGHKIRFPMQAYRIV
ncbi:uncharacterized protein [Asterias amurensis]|uniref:uncharacterized protein n=1 Tax=Asterias amurensis TaxID=7602 RepID=UPI003AB7585F